MFRRLCAQAAQCVQRACGASSTNIGPRSLAMRNHMAHHRPDRPRPHRRRNQKRGSDDACSASPCLTGMGTNTRNNRCELLLRPTYLRRWKNNGSGAVLALRHRCGASTHRTPTGGLHICNRALLIGSVIEHNRCESERVP